MENVAVVIQNGSFSIKAGMSGSQPIAVRTLVGHNKKERAGASTEGCTVTASTAQQGTGETTSGRRHDASIFGEDVLAKKTTLNIKRPIEYGRIHDWENLELLWQYILYQKLNVHPEEHPILATCSAFCQKSNKEKLAEVMFECFNVPALFVAVDTVLSVYNAGRVTGVSVSCGDSVCQSAPIYEGMNAQCTHLKLVLCYL